MDALILLLQAARHHRDEAWKFKNSALASAHPVLARAYLTRSEWHLEVARECGAIDRLIEHGPREGVAA